MYNNSPLQVSRRERQIMEIIYSHGQASVADVLDAMPDPPSYSAVRAMLRILEEKGHLRHKREGRKYVYLPTVDPARARKSVLRNMLLTFFDNSVEKAIASLLDMNSKKLTQEDFERLSKLINEARNEGKGS